MANRRGFLHAASAIGLAGVWPRAAPGQVETNAREGATPTSVQTETHPASLPAEPDEPLNRRLAPILDRHGVPGLIGAVVVKDKLASIGAVGVRKFGSRERLRVGDRVHLGSCTKALTATVLGTLVEQGALAWESTVTEIFPGLVPDIHPDFRALTLDQLLTHRAGLPHDGPWWTLGRSRSTTAQRRVLLARMLREAPETRPGTAFAYSNVGYALAGLMAEQVTGQSWESLLHDRLFKPLGMASAGFGPPGMADSTDEPWGHRERSGRIVAVREDNAPALGPAGTVHASVPDWAKFAALHLQGARGHGRLLRPETFRALHTPKSGDAYTRGGWFAVRRGWAGGLALNHSGSNQSWFTKIWIAPARDFAVLAATNQGGDAADAACEAVIETLILHQTHSSFRSHDDNAGDTA